MTREQPIDFQVQHPAVRNLYLGVRIEHTDEGDAVDFAIVAWFRGDRSRSVRRFDVPEILAIGIEGALHEYHLGGS